MMERGLTREQARRAAAWALGESLREAGVDIQPIGRRHALALLQEMALLEKGTQYSRWYRSASPEEYQAFGQDWQAYKDWRQGRS